MKIYVDIDDVLCETAVSLCDMAERVFGRRVEYRNVREFDLQNVFGLSDSEMGRFRDLSHEPEFLASFAVTPGAVEGLRALVVAGHSVDLVTGRPASSHIGTEMWLDSAGIDGLTVTYVDKYGRSQIYGCNPGDPPTIGMDELAAREYDVAIDDSPLVLSKLAAWHKTCVLVYDRPWNAGFGLAQNMSRIGSWAEALAAVRRLKA